MSGDGPMAAAPPPWTPEVVMDAGWAARLIAGQFPELAGLAVEPFGQGWDNAAFMVGEEWVFRFPQRLVAAPLLARESRALPGLAGRLPLAIPAPTFVGRPADGFPWVFAGYRLLRGTTADRARLDDRQREHMAPVLGGFLRALHAVPVPFARDLGVGHDEIGRLDLGTRLQPSRERLERLGRAGLVPEADVLGEILDATVARFGGGVVPPVRVTLVHGDLYSRHFIVDDGALVGVIDWGDVHIGDVAADLAVVHVFLPASAHAAFAQAYGPIAAVSWELARFRGLFHALATAWYGADTDDEALLTESLGALARMARAWRAPAYFPSS